MVLAVAGEDAGGALISAAGMEESDSTGDDPRKDSGSAAGAVEPLAVSVSASDPAVLTTHRISGTTDIMVYENSGQNTSQKPPATMVEQGAKIHTA